MSEFAKDLNIKRMVFGNVTSWFWYLEALHPDIYAFLELYLVWKYNKLYKENKKPYYYHWKLFALLRKNGDQFIHLFKTYLTYVFRPLIHLNKSKDAVISVPMTDFLNKIGETWDQTQLENPFRYAETKFGSPSKIVAITKAFFISKH